MKRRAFLTSTVGGAAAAAVAASTFPKPALSQGLREWRMTTTWPKNFPAFGTGANLIGDIITKGSGGKLTIKVYGAGEIVPAFEAINAVERGTCEMGHGTSYYWKGKEPAAQFITGMPFGLTVQEQNGWFYAEGNKIAQKVYDRMGCKLFVAGNTGAQMGGWFNKEINAPGDLSGLKIRMPGLGGEVVKELGATVVNLPGGELLPALQTGTIDATEWVGPANDLALGFYKVAKFYYYPGWHEPSGIQDFFVNKQEWEKLPEDLKALVTAAAEMCNAHIVNEFTSKNAAALQSLVNEHRVVLKRFSDETLISLAEKSGEVINDIASQDPLSRELMDSILRFRKQVMQASSYAEQAYMMARSLPHRFAEPSKG